MAYPDLTNHSLAELVSLTGRTAVVTGGAVDDGLEARFPNGRQSIAMSCWAHPRASASEWNSLALSTPMHRGRPVAGHSASTSISASQGRLSAAMCARHEPNAGRRRRFQGDVEAGDAAAEQVDCDRDPGATDRTTLDRVDQDQVSRRMVDLHHIERRVGRCGHPETGSGTTTSPRRS